MTDDDYECATIRLLLSICPCSQSSIILTLTINLRGAVNDDNDHEQESESRANSEEASNVDEGRLYRPHIKAGVNSTPPVKKH